MADPLNWSSEDDAIIATNLDATECKRSAVDLGFWKDDYIQYFCKKAERKTPEINLGYYARYRIMELFINHFLERCGSQSQIVNLGCGFDTLYWRLRDTTKVSNVIEIDFPSVVAKKTQIIRRNKALYEKLVPEEGRDSPWTAEGGVAARDYRLLGADLRTAAGAAAAAAVLGARPALLLAECVLVYMPEEASARLLAALAAVPPAAMMLVYEQCELDDKFGEVMSANLRSRGCALAGLGGARRGADWAAARLTVAGAERAAAWRLDRLRPPPPPHARVCLDEPHLLTQLQAHYCVAAGVRGDLLRDLSLRLSALLPSDWPDHADDDADAD